MKTINIKKGEILQRKGELNSKIYAVKSGLLRSYTIDIKGKEHIYMFAPEDWIIGDNCEPDVPTQLFIDALENSVITVFEKDLGRERVNPAALLRRLNTLQKRVIMLLSSSAFERYEHFLSDYPDIVQRVPQRMIASYLGITPEALSKVKGDQLKNR